MITLKHLCDACDSEFSISYDDMKCEDSPSMCPFCGEYLLEEDAEYEDE